MIAAFLYIGKSGSMGRGVFTKESIPGGTIVETSPVIVMSHEHRLLLDQTLLHDYIFEWGKKHNQCCMALGYIALYNHSYRANCEYVMDYELDLISVCSVRHIQAGEELFINYNGDWDNQKPLWFDAL